MKTLREVLHSQVDATLRKRGLSEEEIEKRKQEAIIQREAGAKSVRK